MPDNSSVENSYRIHDDYGRIYSTIISLMIDPTQDKLQSYHHYLEEEECADAATASTTDASAPIASYYPTAMSAQ